jgi:hypothetical protein
MKVVYAGGAGPRAFSLRLDERGVGADDFLGIEDTRLRIPRAS